jgi:glucosamine-6-phosphate deaminase
VKQYTPQIEIVPDADAAAERGAALVIATLRSSPAATLGLATGATMAPLFARLVAAIRAGEVSFGATTIFNLDEYVGVAPQSQGSFHRYMQEHLLEHIDMESGRAHIPDGMARDVAAEAARYEAQIQVAGGIDLQLLGIGTNGHIGFNEPGSDFSSRTRKVRLEQATRVHEAANFPDGAATPEYAITMGIATILEARHLLLIATGREKAAAIAAAIDGPLTSACPASSLRLHDSVRIICDEAAASALGNRRDKGIRSIA